MQRADSTVTSSKQTVIMSCGVLGASIAAALAERGHTVTILDPRAQAFDRLPRDPVDEGRIVPIIGDGTRHEDLHRASLRDADTFLALSNVDTKNALAAQLAKHVYHVPKVFCRIDDPTIEEMYTRLGIDAISGTALVAQAVLEAGGE